MNLANATLYTRALANTRPNVASCDFLESVARKLYDSNKASSDITIEVIKGSALLAENCNLIYAVGKAAESEPRMIILQYKGDKTSNKISHAIVGKGLTFDTGGLNLKPTNYIEDMYLDKHGACNTLSVFKTVVESGMKINLVCAIGAADNAIDAKSYKPSDIITSRKGYTVEITNTDAEGRLVLADVLTYVQQIYKPERVIDLATLTGACMVALGNKTAGIFTNDEQLSGDIVSAAKEVQEPVWHLPINDEHREDLKSPFADLKNAGKDRYGGASKGAAFLEKFIEKGVKWVHLDIAGPSHAGSTYDCWTQGATGFGTQIILKYLYNFVNKTDVLPEDFQTPVNKIVPNADVNSNTPDSSENVTSNVADMITNGVDMTNAPDDAKININSPTETVADTNSTTSTEDNSVNETTTNSNISTSSVDETGTSLGSNEAEVSTGCGNSPSTESTNLDSVDNTGSPKLAGLPFESLNPK